MSAKCAEDWRFGNLDFYKSETKLNMVPSNNFKSAWMSAGTGQEWIYVDLGTTSTFDKVKLYWINKATKGSIQVSDDANNWTDLSPLPVTGNLVDSVTLNKEAKGRYVRVLMTEPTPGKKYVLSEIEVFGRGGLVPKQKDNPAVSENRMSLAAGNWRIQRASEVEGTGENISRTGL